MTKAELVDLEDPENYKVVLAKVKPLWSHGTVFYYSHAKKRMAERGFDVHDIKNILFYGRVVDHSRPKTNWRFVVQGKSLEGRSGKCVVEINGTLIIVSVYP